MSRKDRYKEYDGIIFRYIYPFKWSKRNKNYLELVIDRDLEEEQDYIFPEERVECRHNGN